MRAIISDIHGNAVALKAVLEHVKGQGVTEILCLGDIVGYGPEPNECVDLVIRSARLVTCGNHDVAVLTQAFGFHKYAREAIDWTREQVKPTPMSLWRQRMRWDYLRNMPDKHVEQDGRIMFVHASPRDPVMEYIEESDCADMGFGPSQKIQDIFAKVQWLCFVGHTHHPGVFSNEPKYRFTKPAELEGGRYDVPETGKTIVNVGSVGQPRDQDPRACYVTVNERSVQYHRVEYDVEKVVGQVKSVARLDERLGTRLRDGK